MRDFLCFWNFCVSRVIMDVAKKFRSSEAGEGTSTRKNTVKDLDNGVVNEGIDFGDERFYHDPDLEDARSVISEARSLKTFRPRQSSVYFLPPKEGISTEQAPKPKPQPETSSPNSNKEGNTMSGDPSNWQTKSILKQHPVKPSYKLKNDIKSVLLMSSKQEIQDVNSRFNRTRRYDTAGKYRIGPTFITKARLSYLDANKPAKLSVIPDPSFKSLEFGLLTYLWTFTDQHDKTEIDLAFLQSLINSGVDINAADEYGQTALHAIVRDWHPDVVSFIIRNNADVNKADKWGRTPLHLAAAINSVEIAKILCLSGGM